MSDNHIHISPLKTYFGIFGCLLVLTVVTVGVSYAGLPSTLSIIVAMMVASLKAFLVAAWFMHLKWDTKFNIFIFSSAFWFMSVFFIFTMFDLGSRGAILQITDNYDLRYDRALEEALVQGIDPYEVEMRQLEMKESGHGDAGHGDAGHGDEGHGEEGHGDAGHGDEGGH